MLLSLLFTHFTFAYALNTQHIATSFALDGYLSEQLKNKKK